MSACPLPVYETPSITPDIQRADKTLMQFSMAKLAGLDAGQDGLAEIEELIALYSGWIADRTQEVTALPEHFRDVATGHLDECIRAVSRMKTGLKLVRTDQHVRLAFQLANRSILLQQIRARREPRSIIYDAKAHRFGFSEAAPSSDILRAPEGKGYWRPFQIAFLLSTLESVANPRSLDRNTVDLIWFPTGGGKTEAYLGLAAFSMFHRRLTKSGDRGVDVLMRYTLRLLTAQQFERAGAVICAMEHIRLTVKLPRANDLGLAPFSIGIWLGGTTTPNRRDEARSLLHQLERGDRDADNKFLLLKCPWCSAQIGPLPQARGEGSDRRHKAPRVIGYAEEGGTVVLRCSDSNCDFSEGLPIYVIDEDIYEYRPSMVIGTVDKFAMLAWRPEARSLFGIEPTGQRSSHPPGLIVQDELHLISGPLGSMVGLYEGVIEYLCTDPDGVKPKLVSSTATIRRFREQVGSLYCREDVALFPPRGLNANDSFFATYAKLQDSTLAPGRMYVGIHAPGLGSLQTAQVRTFAALLQAAGSMTKAEADPWWTLVMFFNSLRELGVTLSLFQSDIRDYLNVLRKRYGLGFGDVRKLRKVIELTGRLRSSEVPESIAALEIPATSQQYPVDACLASNIIEVGIDIDRLSLMAVVGQPKTTAQYIQVTGRVGRRWWERPGLVTTIYSASKPRDRSHFEKFRSYHERLYAGVEPTSVTPFSPAVLDRALHAVMATYVRQIGDPKVANRPYPIPERLVNEVSAVLRNRVKAVDPEEVASLEGMLARRLDEWRRWQRTRWDGRQQDDDIPLLREAGHMPLLGGHDCPGPRHSPCAMSMRSAKPKSPTFTSSKTAMSRGPIRRAQVVAPFGVGALTVVPGGTSLIGAGLDHWFASPDGETDSLRVDIDAFRLEEWRLQQALGVSHFRLPPDFRKRRMGEPVTNTGLTIPYLRFPRWHFCHRCHLLCQQPLTARGRLKCPDCQLKNWTNYLAQVPFVAMCDAGHLQDFPWREWVHRSVNPTCGASLRLIATGSATLAGQLVKCDCGAVKPRNLTSITEADADGAHTHLSDSLDASGTAYLCRGCAPWHGSDDPTFCGRAIRGSLRSASNLYFALVRSSVYLPRGSSDAPSQLITLLEQPPLSTLISLLRQSDVVVTAPALRGQHFELVQQFTDDQITAALDVTASQGLTGQSTVVPDDDRETAFRRPEFSVLRQARDDDQLVIREALLERYDPVVRDGLDRLMLVDKLRETRALFGFNRVLPERDDDLAQRKAML